MSEIKDLQALPLRELSIEVLRQVAMDSEAPAAARGACARSLAEICGLLGKNAETLQAVEGKGLTEMSLGEIDAELARLAPGVKKNA